MLEDALVLTNLDKRKYLPEEQNYKSLLKNWTFKHEKENLDTDFPVDDITPFRLLELILALGVKPNNDWYEICYKKVSYDIESKLWTINLNFRKFTDGQMSVSCTFSL